MGLVWPISTVVFGFGQVTAMLVVTMEALLSQKA
jgi:hypothetical protein